MGLPIYCHQCYHFACSLAIRATLRFGLLLVGMEPPAPVAIRAYHRAGAESLLVDSATGLQDQYFFSLAHVTLGYLLFLIFLLPKPGNRLRLRG